MMFFLFYLLPIIIIGFIVYFDMEHGQTLKEYAKVNDLEMLAIFTCIPVCNFLILLLIIIMIVWDFIGNFRKP